MAAFQGSTELHLLYRSQALFFGGGGPPSRLLQAPTTAAAPVEFQCCPWWGAAPAKLQPELRHLGQLATLPFGRDYHDDNHKFFLVCFPFYCAPRTYPALPSGMHCHFFQFMSSSMTSC